MRVQVKNPLKILNMPRFWWFEVSRAHYFAAHQPILPYGGPTNVTPRLFLVDFDTVWVKEVISEGKRLFLQISKSEAADWLSDQGYILLPENIDEFLQAVIVIDDTEFLNRHRPPELN